MSGPCRPPWLCLQIGAREHYAIPRVLAKHGRLRALATDAWVPPANVMGLLGRHLRERFHGELASAQVKAWTIGLAWLEFAARFTGRSNWPHLLARNGWFQRRAARYLRKLPADMTPARELVDRNSMRERGVLAYASGYDEDRACGRNSGHPAFVFSYSYAALEPFRVAKQRGWLTVLGQIDPGPPEARIVAELSRRYPDYAARWEPPPEHYWVSWREECRLADMVMVNSEWSREALLSEGVPGDKVLVVPLAYDPPQAAGDAGRRYPAAFSPSRPLRVLYLGQVLVRKGIHDLVAAAELLVGEPVAVDVVGPHGPLPGSLPRNLVFHGPVPRGEAARWYREADLFVLPTHSDGFALTQLEAMAYGLPVIATRRCGDVVEHGRNGWIVEHGAPEQLADVVREAIANSTALAGMSEAASRRAHEFSLERLGSHLLRLETMLLDMPARGRSTA